MARDAAHDIALHDFTAMDSSADLAPYLQALIAFDAIEQMQELEQVERATIVFTARG